MQTATNPTTGEQLMWNGTAWVPAGGGAAPAPAPAAGAPVTVGTPRPPKPDKPSVTTVGGTVLTVDPVSGTATPIFTAPEKPEDKPKVSPEERARIKALGLSELLGHIETGRRELRAGDAKGFAGRFIENWVTGYPGAVGRTVVPGSDAADFSGTLTSLTGSTITEKLKELKAESPTGASGMGSLTETEATRLASAIGALSPNLSSEKYEQTFNAIERHTRALMAISDGLDPRDPKVAAQYGIPPIDATAGGAPAGDQGPRLSDEDLEAQLRNRVARKENPADTIKWLIENRVNPDEELIQAIIANAGNPNARAEVTTKEPEGTSPFSVSLGGIAEGAGDFVGILGNPVNAIVNAATGSNLSTDLGRTFREYAGLPEAENNTQRTINAIGGGALAGGGVVGLARGAAGYLSRQAPAVAGALNSFLRTPVTDVAAAGTGAGASEVARQEGAGVLGQMVAGLAGGGAVAARPLAQSLRRGPDGGIDPATARAAEEHRVRIPARLVAEGRRGVNRAGVLEADTETAPIIQQGFARVDQDIEQAVGRFGQGGTARNPADQGEVLRQAATQIREADRQGATAAYEAARRIQPDAMVDPAGMRARIDDRLRRLAARPNQNADEIRTLQRYRADLNNPLPLQEIRDMRTNAWENVNGGLTASPSQKRADRFMMEVVDGANDDMQRALSPEAMAAYREADALVRENKTLYREAFKPIFGDDFDKLPAEMIFERVKTAAQRNGRALAGLHRRLTGEQSRDLAATIVEGLGRRPSTDPATEPFSVATFLQQARRLSPSARETLFGPSGAESFNNLLRLSRRMSTLRDRVNYSQTAPPVMNTIRKAVTSILTGTGTIGGALSNGVEGAMVGGGAAVLAGQAAQKIGSVRAQLSARALMNPRVSRWMLEASEASTRQEAENAVRRLGVIMLREPGLEPELAPLHDALTQPVTSRLAAQPEGDDNESR